MRMRVNWQTRSSLSRPSAVSALLSAAERVFIRARFVSTATLARRAQTLRAAFLRTSAIQRPERSLPFARRPARQSAHRWRSHWSTR
jgi:hypothetical protein